MLTPKALPYSLHYLFCLKYSGLHTYFSQLARVLKILFPFLSLKFLTMPPPRMSGETVRRWSILWRSARVKLAFWCQPGWMTSTRTFVSDRHLLYCFWSLTCGLIITVGESSEISTIRHLFNLGSWGFSSSLSVFCYFSSSVFAHTFSIFHPVDSLRLWSHVFTVFCNDVNFFIVGLLSWSAVCPAMVTALFITVQTAVL